LKPNAHRAREKAESLRKEMGYTLESFISYLERLRMQIDQENKERFLDDELKNFEKTHKCILKLAELTKNVDSNLEEIRNTVEEGSRSGLDASFDISRKRVNMILNYKSFHNITLIEYLHYLKYTTIPNDVEKLEKSITEICLKITERIESNSVFASEVESLRCKIKYYNELLEEKKRCCND
jgi:esterase/lipase